MTASLQKIEALPMEYNKEKIELLTNTVCKGASQDELSLFLHVCKRTGLDPFMKQIYSIPRGGQRTIQTSIDGLRLIAERTGKYSPGKEPVYVYSDKNELISATSFIKKMTPDGTWHDISATAIYKEYNPGNNNFWKKMPHVMLAKCAEASALRKAFPAEMSGIYSEEEMDQANKKEPSTDTQEICVEPVLVDQQEVEEYLSTWEENKEKFRLFMTEIMTTRKWDHKRVLEAFKKNTDFTKNAFETWLNKE